MAGETSLNRPFAVALNLSIDQKNETRIAGGLKATINNPKVSQEAKSNAHERLREMGTSADASADQIKRDIGADTNDAPEDPDSSLTQQQLGGYKATLKNPKVSEGAKQHAQEVLEAHDQA
ncbi:hypothetical protein C0995_012391 [Termitomyces sp. Mi166|nr:hypothetical protein C0995_012391 [Termitomyces sp. Mi166\